MTTHTTTSLTAFLLARYDDAEAEVQHWPSDGPWGLHPSGRMWTDAHGHPVYAPRDRILAEVKAHRAIVAEHEMMPARQSSLGTMHLQDGRQLSTYYLDGCCSTCTAGGEYGSPADPETGALDYCPTLRILASIYSAHPDYDESWAEALRA